MAKKRGGDQRIVSIDVEAAERSYRNEPVDGWTAEKIFDRRWGIEVLRQALQMLEAEYQSKNQELFEALRSRLTSDADDAVGYAEIAEQVGMTPSAIKTASMRLRKRYKALLRQIVAETLDKSESVDDELSELLVAIRGSR
jgi:RNA polymerase sigma-70 factor (ECF subfamily)